MKAALLRAPLKLTIEDIAEPTCPTGGAKVSVKACSICTTDAEMFANGHRDLKYPRILGHEVAGVVVEGEAIGERVQIYPGICCGECPPCLGGAENQCRRIAIIGFSHHGGFAERVIVPPRGVLNPIPPNLSYEEASLAEPLASAINGHEMAGLKQGDSVLVVGAGPLGLLNAALARANGAESVLVAETLPQRLAPPKGFNIDRLIDSQNEPLGRAVAEETGGQGVDVIIPACSQADPAQLLPLLKPRGRLCLFSGGRGSPKTPMNGDLIHYRELAVVGAYGSTASQNRRALSLIASGEVPASRLITQRLPLEGLERGLELAQGRRGLKTIITFP